MDFSAPGHPVLSPWSSNFMSALAPLLETPFALFGGEDDPETGSEDLDAWQQHCKSTFCCHMFPGGHFFIRSAQKQLLSRLIRELAGSV